MAELQREQFLADFVGEAREILDTVEERLLGLSTNPEQRPEFLQSIKRGLHTIKGNAGMVGLTDLQQLAHGMEDGVAQLDRDAPDPRGLLDDLDRCRQLLEAAQSKAAEAPGAILSELSSGSVRIQAHALDSLVDRLAEMVILRNRMLATLARCRAVFPVRELWNELEEAEQHLARNLKQMRAEIMGLRLVPLHNLFGRLRRIVYDEAASREKEAELSASGGQTPLDKALLEAASQALGHLVRNAVIHGIEPPEERRRFGKPPRGQISLSTEIRGDEAIISLSDDGKGIDREAVRALAAREGIETEDPRDLLSALFLPGVTTHGTADIGAGRGMGLSAALEAIKRLGGRITVHSEEGEGTRFQLFLPLVVSITRALLIEADGERYALPLATVAEVQRLDMPSLDEQRWRDQQITVLDLGRCFGTASESCKRDYFVVIDVDGRFRSLLIDRLTEVREIVVKGLDPLLGQIPGIAGATVLSDGDSILILDPVGLMELPAVPLARSA